MLNTYWLGSVDCHKSFYFNQPLMVESKYLDQPLISRGSVEVYKVEKVLKQVKYITYIKLLLNEHGWINLL